MKSAAGCLAGMMVFAAVLIAPQRSTAAEERTPGESQTSASRPGVFRLGPFYLTPKLRVGTLGLDTNVFYTATDRRTDFTASGGPGLEIVLPTRALRVALEGGASYVYFARTASQRKLGGDGRARLELVGNRLQAGIEQTFSRTFQRPNFEVDRRVLQDQWITRGDLAVRIAGNLGARAGVQSSRIDVEAGQDFLGTDLRSTLSREERRAVLGLQYHLTLKTSLLIEGDYQTDRFEVSPMRDADSNRLYGGFEVASTTRLTGRAVGGVRLLRLLQGPGKQTSLPYVDVDLTYQFGPKARVTGRHTRDLSFSAFDTSGGTPTLRMESYSLRIEKGLIGRLDLHVFGTLTKLRTDGAIAVTRPQGELLMAIRDDDARQGGADLGYLFRNRVRIGIAATYTERRSTIQDFGIEGLLVGGTVTYAP